MKKKVIVLLVLVVILIFVSGLSIKKIKAAKEIKTANIVNKDQNQPLVKKGSISEEKKETASKEKSIFEEEMVVTKEIYPRKKIDGSEISEDVMPIGTVVSVKAVPTDDKWVEIISDPKKGYIEKDVLEFRDGYISKREQSRKKELSPAEFKESLDKALVDFKQEHGGDITVYIETVDHKFTYNSYADEVRRTASSIKLAFISYVMTLADDKKIDLDTKLTYTANYKMGGTGIIQFAPIGTEYTIKELAELTIRYSDNVAYTMLVNYIGEPQFIQFLAELDPNSPNNRYFSTAHILTKSMNYVYDRKDKSENIKLIYDWMQDSTFDDGVAVGLPGVDVVHKTGWMPMYMVSNDISLVKDKETPYYLTIMTGGYGEDYSEKSIGDLAKIVDKHMLRLDYK